MFCEQKCIFVPISDVNISVPADMAAFKCLHVYFCVCSMRGFKCFYLFLHV